MHERETKKDERLPYSPPEIVFEAHTEALAAACDPGSSTCPSKDQSPNNSCGGGIPGNCSALKS